MPSKLKQYLKYFASWDLSKIIGMSFIALLMIILFIWMNNEQRLYDMQVVIEQNQQASRKMQLVNRLIEIARARTRLTGDVIYEEDPFVQDEIAVELDVLASRFARLRATLLELQLSERERDLLGQQAAIVPVILPTQRRAVELAMSGDAAQLRESEKLLYEVVNPGQNSLVSVLTDLIDYQQANIDALAVQSQASYEAAQLHNSVLVGVVFLVGSVFSAMVVLRVRTIQRKVVDAREQLENAVDMRTMELAESQSMLQTVLDTIPARVFWKDVAGKYLGCNRMFARDAGTDDISSITGKTDADLAWSDHAAEYTQEDLKVIDSGESIIDREEIGTLTDGKIWREMTKVPLTNNSGQIVGMLGSYHDITDRKEMERIKDDFVSTVSHELRTPLTSIRGSIGLLLGTEADALSPQGRKLLDLAERNTERLLALINDLLDMQKMLLGEMSFDFEPMNFEKVLRKSIEENAHYATQYGVEFVVNESTPVTVRIDEKRMMQVMANLLSNAAKFSPPDQRVELSLQQVSDHAVVSVTDHGEGIPEQFHDVLFERFTQVDSSDTRQKGGTGLGLAISRSIVEGHGGVIGFDTEQGVGTTFYFKLPVVHANEAGQDASMLAS